MNPVRSMILFLHLEQNVFSPSWPGTLPIYTYSSPQDRAISRALSRVDTGVGGRFFSLYRG